LSPRLRILVSDTFAVIAGVR